MTPAERSQRARIAAFTLHSKYDSRQITRAARAAFLRRFETQVDPHGVLHESERQRRAEAARKAYSYQLAAKSAQARRSQRKLSGRRERDRGASRRPDDS